MFQRARNRASVSTCGCARGAAADPGDGAAHRSDLATDRHALGRLHAITLSGVVGTVLPWVIWPISIHGGTCGATGAWRLICGSGQRSQRVIGAGELRREAGQDVAVDPRPTTLWFQKSAFACDLRRSLPARRLGPHRNTVREPADSSMDMIGRVKIVKVTAAQSAARLLSP